MEKVLGLCFIVFLLFVSCGGGVEENKSRAVGLTFLGLRSETVECEQVFEMLEGIEQPAISFLWESFGEHDECLDEFLADSRPKIVQVFLVNAVCLRKGNCAGADLDGYDAVIDDAISAYDSIFPRIRAEDTLLLTPALEDDLKDLDFQYIAEEIQFYAPGAEIVRNRNGLQITGEHCAGVDVCELHNQAIPVDVNADIGWSNDGHDLDLGGDVWGLPYKYTREDVLSRITERFRGARVVYLWKATFNGLVGDSGGAIPPHERDINVSEHDIEQINLLLQEIQYVQ